MASSTANSNTGTKDATYDLVSVLYHALKSSETYDTYIEDAQETGDTELVKFFRSAKNAENKRADQARTLLAARLK